MKTAAILTLVLSASAQTYSSHSGWSFSDTLQTASDVVVADIVAGSAVDTGSQVVVNATLRAVRVLKGDIAPGTDFTLQWHYQAGPVVTTGVPQTRGLWFLRKNSGGVLELLNAGMPGPMNGSFLELAANGSPIYSDAEPFQTKIAREIVAALEDVAVQHAADLAPHQPDPGARGALPAWVSTRSRFQTLTMVLQSLEQSAVVAVYQDLSQHPDPNLKALGILGRLQAGDPSAVFDLEKNLASVGSSYEAASYAAPSLNLDLSKNLPAAHALARIVLSDTSLPALEDTLAFALARSRSPEMLPYLIVMLESPRPGVRDSALMGFCQLLGPMPTPSAFWSAEMEGYCPHGSPINDRELEQRDTQFWKQWWDSHRDEIAKTVTLPTVAAPARYGAARQEAGEVPMEVRFEALLHTSSAAPPEHYHAADGTIVETPPSSADASSVTVTATSVPPDLISGQLDPVDREVFRQVIDSANAKLTAIQARAMQMMSAARIRGTLPSREQAESLNAERESAVRAGLTDLQSKLSPGGWQVVERFLKSMAIVSSRVASPAK